MNQPEDEVMLAIIIKEFQMVLKNTCNCRMILQLDSVGGF